MQHLLKKLLPELRLLCLLFLILVAPSCDSKKPDAQQVIEAAITAHGWRNHEKGVVSFKVDNVLYRVLQDEDAFLYSRTFENKEGQRVHDVLSNSGFSRTIDDKEVAVEPEEGEKYSEELKSVVLLAVLPNGLQNAAGHQRNLGSVTLNKETYYKISVSIDNGNGNAATHLEGDYLLWFHKEKHTLDYLAYIPHKRRKRARLCRAVNPREVEGIRFQDYNHYSTNNRISPRRLDYAFEAKKLEKVSETKLEQIKVSPLPKL